MGAGYDWGMDNYHDIATKAADDVRERADAANQKGELLSADVATLIDSGYTTLAIPKAYGGYGASLADCLAAQVELAQANPSSALVAGMNMQVTGNERETRTWRDGRRSRAGT